MSTKYKKNIYKTTQSKINLNKENYSYHFHNYLLKHINKTTKNLTIKIGIGNRAATTIAIKEFNNPYRCKRRKVDI